MFADYERLVLADYQLKKSTNLLSSSLMYTTQAKLKKECLRLCQVKILGKDEKVIRDFIEDWDNTKTCLQNISNYDVDKFKPLSNFIKGITENTDTKNIQLLAWLIDFPHRPFDYTKDYSSPITQSSNPDENEIVDAPTTSEDQPAITDIITIQKPQTTNPKRKLRKILIAASLLATIGTVGYWWRDTTVSDKDRNQKNLTSFASYKIPPATNRPTAQANSYYFISKPYVRIREKSVNGGRIMGKLYLGTYIKIEDIDETGEVSVKVPGLQSVEGVIHTGDYVDSLDKLKITEEQLNIFKSRQYAKFEIDPAYEAARRQQTASTSRPESPKTRTYIKGPRGGCYYINANGHKVYVDRSFCQ